uniref:Uncharacterized protein n=1 Tax=Sphaerodactylus townsendi TaxID=933632 RepID=A0ACB8GAV8_9SAUR
MHGAGGGAESATPLRGSGCVVSALLLLAPEEGAGFVGRYAGSYGDGPEPPPPPPAKAGSRLPPSLPARRPGSLPGPPPGGSRASYHSMASPARNARLRRGCARFSARPRRKRLCSICCLIRHASPLSKEHSQFCK